MCEQAAFGSGYDHMAGCCKLEINFKLHKILGFKHLSDSVSGEQFCVNVLKFIKHTLSFHLSDSVSREQFCVSVLKYNKLSTISNHLSDTAARQQFCVSV
jgi:hypothetical protein